MGGQIDKNFDINEVYIKQEMKMHEPIRQQVDLQYQQTADYQIMESAQFLSKDTNAIAEHMNRLQDFATRTQEANNMVIKSKRKEALIEIEKEKRIYALELDKRKMISGENLINDYAKNLLEKNQSINNQPPEDEFIQKDKIKKLSLLANLKFRKSLISDESDVFMNDIALKTLEEEGTVNELAQASLLLAQCIDVDTRKTKLSPCSNLKELASNYVENKHLCEQTFELERIFSENPLFYGILSVSRKVQFNSILKYNKEFFEIHEKAHELFLENKFDKAQEELNKINEYKLFKIFVGGDTKEYKELEEKEKSHQFFDRYILLRNPKLSEQLHSENVEEVEKAKEMINIRKKSRIYESFSTDTLGLYHCINKALKNDIDNIKVSLTNLKEKDLEAANEKISQLESLLKDCQSSYDRLSNKMRTLENEAKNSGEYNFIHSEFAYEINSEKNQEINPNDMEQQQRIRIQQNFINGEKNSNIWDSLKSNKNSRFGLKNKKDKKYSSVFAKAEMMREGKLNIFQLPNEEQLSEFKIKKDKFNKIQIPIGGESQQFIKASVEAIKTYISQNPMEYDLTDPIILSEKCEYILTYIEDFKLLANETGLIDPAYDKGVTNVNSLPIFNSLSEIEQKQFMAVLRYCFNAGNVLNSLKTGYTNSFYINSKATHIGEIVDSSLIEEMQEDQKHMLMRQLYFENNKELLQKGTITPEFNGAKIDSEFLTPLQLYSDLRVLGSSITHKTFFTMGHEILLGKYAERYGEDGLSYSILNNIELFKEKLYEIQEDSIEKQEIIKKAKEIKKTLLKKDIVKK